jgi:hypothetical protein
MRPAEGTQHDEAILAVLEHLKANARRVRISLLRAEPIIEDALSGTGLDGRQQRRGAA